MPGVIMVGGKIPQGNQYCLAYLNAKDGSNGHKILVALSDDEARTMAKQHLPPNCRITSINNCRLGRKVARKLQKRRH